MRFVTVENLCAGMTLARDLYRNTEIMLAKGVELTQRYVDGINRLGFPGAYIVDELSEDLRIEPVVSDKLRMEVTQRLIEARSFISEEDSGSVRQGPDVLNQINNVVSELSASSEVMVNIRDLSSYDDYTYSHSLNVMLLSVLLGRTLKLSRDDLVGLGAGALFHDIGKMHVNKRILLKEGALSDEEFEIMKAHPQDGYNDVRNRFSIDEQYLLAILEHHEKFDGSGYPNRKQGDDISLYGRICAVADVYDALNSRRPYREAMPVHECVEYIMSGTGSHFDPEVVDAFLVRIAPYPLGSSVRLSNGWCGLVIKNHLNYGLRPTLRIYEQNGQRVKPFEISLRDDPKYLNVTVMGIA